MLFSSFFFLINHFFPYLGRSSADIHEAARGPYDHIYRDHPAHWVRFNTRRSQDSSGGWLRRVRKGIKMISLNIFLFSFFLSEVLSSTSPHHFVFSYHLFSFFLLYRIFC
jgi:hypothetical protein